ncbi:MAG: hypothetical protein COA94_03695 [Rickettsiales bacterium]|nr:MAG: hypothetical protein COA94_03695 [Rickettsiales bacterium]
MPAHMKKHLTKNDITILVRGEAIELKDSVKSSLANIIGELVGDDSVSASEVHGDWLNSPRMRVAKYLKGVRNKEGLTQGDVCKKLGIQQSNLSKMESGERSIPPTLVGKFSKLYKVSVKRLQETEQKKKKAS